MPKSSYLRTQIQVEYDDLRYFLIEEKKRLKDYNDETTLQHYLETVQILEEMVRLLKLLYEMARRYALSPGIEYLTPKERELLNKMKNILEETSKLKQTWLQKRRAILPLPAHMPIDLHSYKLFVNTIEGYLSGRLVLGTQ